MAYQVLARKWRPQRFDDVVGQQAVTRTLRNALGSGRLAHAFVFAGPRGVGKTTTARILARALSCVKGPTADPCGERGEFHTFVSSGPGFSQKVDYTTGERVLREQRFMYCDLIQHR